MYAQHFIVGNSLYNHLLSLILRKIPNRLPKMVFALSVEHDLRAENIRSIIILDVENTLPFVGRVSGQVRLYGESEGGGGGRREAGTTKAKGDQNQQEDRRA